ncbi:putative ABC transport system ATP-binding protein [Aeribacillus composti]|uniref:ABC transporter ATP-binding protein n=1 Tax=Aeribacillus TaxID=1055323 RepID=UPI001199D437|nr:ABC transporter ATP-binding protein [Aeribacillus composti]TVZ75434.1 putative ABC transport system ATP-binding protein [Aeribacillus composti]
MSIILKAEEISKSFNTYNNYLVVKPTSFSVKKGEIYVIEGKSGSGKSTFLSMIGGLEKPSNGRVFFENKSFYELNDNEQSRIRGESFGFIFQSFQLIPELTVKENIELPFNFVKASNKNMLNVNELANELDISRHLSKKPNYLSGGEQQRVAIARALITCPKILFADEPTGNLDQETTKLVIKLLIKLSKKYNISLIIVTHEKNLIKEPHYLYKMNDGVLKVENKHD